MPPCSGSACGASPKRLPLVLASAFTAVGVVTALGAAASPDVPAAGSGSDRTSSNRSIAREALKSTGLTEAGSAGTTTDVEVGPVTSIASVALAPAGGAGTDDNLGDADAALRVGVDFDFGLDFTTFFPEVDGVRAPVLRRTCLSGDMCIGWILGGSCPKLYWKDVPRESNHVHLARESVSHLNVTTGVSKAPSTISRCTPSGRR
mmetsp:Transcript_19898/g.48374  ORF Transcript_19898/g.48374 Transcript_19898/m.48374 type:complete len:205 (-) Transcript_19898:1036-1650(-)